MKPTARILIIEDDSDVREILEYQAQVFCESKNLQPIITSSENGRDGMKELRDSKFDLVLLDLRLPDIHGSEVLDFKNNKLGNDTPTIVLSGNISEHGDDGTDKVVYLQKPASFERLSNYFKILLRPILMPTPKPTSGTWDEL